MMHVEDYKREILFIIFAQKRTILKVALGIALFSVFIALFWPSTYEAVGSIIVKGKQIENEPDLIDRRDSRSYPATLEDLLSEVEILRSHDVIVKTVESLHEKKLDDKIRKKIDRVLRDEVNLAKNLKVDLVPGSNVFRVRYLHGDPAVALEILDALMKQYVSFRTKVFSSIEEEVFITEQLNRFSNSLREKEGELLTLAEKSQIPDPGKEIEHNIIIKHDLELQLSALRTLALEKALLRDYLGRILERESIQYFTFDELRVDKHEAFDKQLAELHGERRTVLKTFDPSSDKVKAIDGQIDSLLRSEITAYRENLVAELDIVNSKMSDMRERLKEIALMNIALEKQRMTSRRLTSEAELLQYSYETFYKKNEEAKVNSRISEAQLPLYISILSGASVSDVPVFPRKSVVIPLGLFVGLLVGSTVGFLREYFDHTFKRPADVEKYADLKVIYSIPDVQEN